MIRVSLASKEACPTCGGDTIEGFDGGSDTPFEYCERVTPVLRGSFARAAVEEHAKTCQGGCDGSYFKEWRCDFFAAPARWLASALTGTPGRRSRTG
jgi:hypothetical protein